MINDNLGGDKILLKASFIDPGNLKKKNNNIINVFNENNIKTKYKPQFFLDEIIRNNLSGATEIYNYFYNKPKQLSKEQSEFYSGLVRAIIYNIKLSLVDILKNKSFRYYIYPEFEFSLKSDIFTNDRLYWINIAQKVIKNKEMFNLLKFDEMIINLQTIAIPIDKNYYRGYIQDYNKNFSFIGNKVLVNKNDEISEINSFEINEFNKKFGNVNMDLFVYENDKYRSYNFLDGAALIAPDELFYNTEKFKETIRSMNIINSKGNLKEGLKIIEIKNEKSIYFSQEFKPVDFAPCFVSFEKGTGVPFSFLFTLEFDMIELENYLYKNNKDAKTIGKFLNIKNLVHWETWGLMCNFLMVEYATRFNNYNNELRMNILKFLKDWEKYHFIFGNIKTIALKILNFFVKFFDSFKKKINLIIVKKLNDKFIIIQREYKMIDKFDILKIKKIIEKYDLRDSCLSVYTFLTNCELGNINELFTHLDIFFIKFNTFSYDNIVRDLKFICRKIFNLFITDENIAYCIQKIR